KYQVLKATDVSSSTILIDPSLPGQRNKTLAWFWTIDVSGRDANNDWIIKFFRVQWLHAKASRDQFREKVELVQLEMGWTLNDFARRAGIWDVHHRTAEQSDDWGQACYAAKEAALWHELKDDATRVVQRFEIATNNEHRDV
ncbi:hypothetical protein HYDPIDRAFT_91498, partial [Hydnomerulius pinastri MD-312]